MRNTTHRAGVVLVASAILLALPLQAQASPGAKRFTTVDIHTNFTEAAPVLLPSTACPGPDCGFQAHDTTLFIGPDVYATEEYSLYGALPDPAHPGALEYHGTAVVHVTKSPCGTGTFTQTITNGTYYVSRIDPVTQTVPTHDTWTIDAGSGTGQLVGLSGTGTDDVPDASLTLAGVTGDPTANKGTHDGKLTCRLR